MQKNSNNAANSPQSWEWETVKIKSNKTVLTTKKFFSTIHKFKQCPANAEGHCRQGKYCSISVRKYKDAGIFLFSAHSVQFRRANEVLKDVRICTHAKTKSKMQTQDQYTFDMCTWYSRQRTSGHWADPVICFSWKYAMLVMTKWKLATKNIHLWSCPWQLPCQTRCQPCSQHFVSFSAFDNPIWPSEDTKGQRKASFSRYPFPQPGLPIKLIF